MLPFTNPILTIGKGIGMSYIFIDESGDLGDRGSRYFILAAVLVEDDGSLKKLIKKTRERYKKEIGRSNEIKGFKTPQNVKKSILKRLNKNDYKAYILIFEKKHKYKFDYENDNNKLYDILASHLAKIIDIKGPTSIFIDKTKNKKDKMEEFNELFKGNLNNLKNFPIKISHVDSKDVKGIQIADLISWSTYQCMENNNDEYFSLIKNMVIKRVYED